MIVCIGINTIIILDQYMAVSKNRGTPKSSILIGLSLINHPFWGTTIFGSTHMILYDSYSIYGSNSVPSFRQRVKGKDYFVMSKNRRGFWWKIKPLEEEIPNLETTVDG